MRVTILFLLGALLVVYLGVTSISRNEGGEDTGAGPAVTEQPTQAAPEELTNEEYAAANSVPALPDAMPAIAAPPAAHATPAADITWVGGCIDSTKGCHCLDRAGKVIPDLTLADCRGVIAAGPH